ncbi:MAG: mobile mystery protein A [Rhodospirillaceae bacterium]|nr:mobile mystery protein A [Rhodospirillaceae bacterium]
MNHAIARSSLDQKLGSFRNTGLRHPPAKGWIRAIRDALGMTTYQMAKRLGVSQPRIIVLERDEVKGTVTLQTLQRAAEALNCTLVYALVPNTSLQDMVQTQASVVADQRLKAVNQTMQLEDQGVGKADIAKKRGELTQELAEHGGARLWD